MVRTAPWNRCSEKDKSAMQHSISMGEYLKIRQPLKRAMSLWGSLTAKQNLSLNQGYGKRLSGRLLYFRFAELVDNTIRKVKSGGIE